MSLRTSALHKWRRLTQVGFGIVFINSYIPVIWDKVLYSGPLRSVCVPVLNCHSCPSALFACPIGMLQHFSAIQQFPFFILGFLGLVGITFGRAACGWFCPFGLVQDLMYKIKSVKYRIPKFFSYFKYAFLVVLVLILPYFTGTHWFSRLCPWGGIIASIPWVTWNPDHPLTEMPAVPEDGVGLWFGVKVGIVVFFLVLFVITKRPFCYTSCPLGAIFSFFNKYSLFKIEVDEECTQCDRCREKCALNMVAYENANNPNCVECLECVACENVKPRFNFNNVQVPFPTTPGPACQNACPVGIEAWRYIAHIQRCELDEAYNVIRKPNPFPSVCARVCHHPCENKCGATENGGDPVAIRALKRFVTDRIDPATFKPMKALKPREDMPGIAIIGAGPAGLTAAHYLSLKGYSATIFEKDAEPGGMLISGIPPYRLPREVLKKEIDALLDENITLRCNEALGRDFTIDGLFDEGYKAVFLAMGAHKSRRLGIENEDAGGVYTAIHYLKKYNLYGKNSAKGHVCVIGGGNSAIDAARTALRQEGVDNVTVIYRRTRGEMPAIPKEVEAALAEGVTFKFLTSPVEIITKNGCVSGIRCIENKLGEVDASGRRSPVPAPDSEHTIKADTLIVAIGEQPDTGMLDSFGFALVGDRLTVNGDTMETSKAGVFAGGDVVTGPYTVIDAIAAGSRATVMIDRYIQGEPLLQPESQSLPGVYIAPPASSESESGKTVRTEPPAADVAIRRKTFDEIEGTYSAEDARAEAARCRRCDLHYVQKPQNNSRSRTA